jgi:hypothetical protein
MDHDRNQWQPFVNTTKTVLFFFFDGLGHTYRFEGNFGRRPTGRPRRKLEDNIKMDAGIMDFEDAE